MVREWLLILEKGKKINSVRGRFSAGKEYVKDMESAKINFISD